MKKIMLLCSISCLFASMAIADQWVNGYTRSDGTYVQGHYRTSPDSIKSNNYSYDGNTNPYNGKKGYNKGW